MEVRITVIVPVWNREGLLRRALDSIVFQSLKPLEIIVVDNNSSDSTFEVAQDWIKEHKEEGIILKLLKEERPGACHARQKGLENAEGDFVIFFDSDDKMRPTMIESAVATLSGNPDSDIVCWKCTIHQLDGSERIPTFMADKPLEAHLIHALLRPQGYMVRRDFIEKAGGWKKPVVVWNDYELGLRLLLSNPKIVAIDNVLADIYAQEESITGLNFSSKAGLWEKTLQEMEKELEKSDHTDKQRLIRIITYRKAILASHYYREGNKKLAEELMKKAVENSGFFEKAILRFSYIFTRSGLRGAWRLVRYFI